MNKRSGKAMKILFIFPNYDCPIGISIGVSYLSSVLKQEGFETKIIHINEEIGYPYDEDRIIEDVELFGADVVAFSIGENHYKDMCKLGRRIKEKLNVLICMGGIHVTINAESLMNENDFIDYCILGDGEEPLKELMIAIRAHKETINIKNVWARIGDMVYRNQMRPLQNNFSLPPMDLEGWEFEKITKMRRGWINVSLNRGCPYRCSYCHNIAEANVLKENFHTKGIGNKELGYLRLRNVDNIIQELEEIIHKYDYIKEISFIDDTFTFDKEYMKVFLKEYQHKINLPFVCLTTINDLDQELIQCMKDANCDMIRFGVEAASERIRKNVIRRNFPEKKMREVFRLCHEAGIRTFAYNMIANPSETRDEMLSTLRVNAELAPDGVRVSLGYPYKGTPYYEIAKSMDMLDDEADYHNYSTYTKFKFSEEDKLWIDKCRLYFKWWLNMFLSEETKHVYEKLVQYLEQLSVDEWNDDTIRSELVKLDEATSNEMKEKGIIHYTSPFFDRPDIVILYKDGLRMSREEIDEH